jgi:hypothetical protein
MTADKKPTFTDLLKGAKLPERTVEVCLRADLAAEFDLLERQLAEAQQKSPDSLAGTGAADLAERIEALQAQMREHTYPFRLRALKRHEFKKLMDAHPPRRGDDGEIVEADRLSACNTEAMFPVLIRACVYDPQPSDEEWQLLLDETLTDYQFTDLANVAWYLNQGSIDVPFSFAVSQLRRGSAAE